MKKRFLFLMMLIVGIVETNTVFCQVSQKSFDSLKAVINDMKNQSISFDSQLPVIAGKVTNASTAGFMDSTRKNRYSPAPVVNTATSGFVDSVRKGLFNTQLPAGLLAFMDSTRRGYYGNNSATAGFIDSTRKINQTVTLFIGDTNEKLKTISDSMESHNNRIITVETSVNTLNGRIIDSSISLRKSINNLNTIMYQTNTKRIDSVSTAMQQTTGIINGYDITLKTINESISLLKTDIIGCKEYDAILEKTMFIFPKKPQ